VFLPFSQKKEVKMSKMKRSEARILIFLSVCPDRYKYARHIASKLSMDYCYTLQILNSLKMFKTIIPIKRGNKIFYELNKLDQLEKAKIRLGKK